MEDQAFRDPSIKDRDVYRVILADRLLPIEWNSIGAARSGLEVERHRLVSRHGGVGP
jgi:hypothetical protein